MSSTRKINVQEKPKVKRINLTIDKDFEEVLQKMRVKYPLLKDIDIIRMAVSGYYADHRKDFDDRIEQQSPANRDSLS